MGILIKRNWDLAGSRISTWVPRAPNGSGTAPPRGGTRAPSRCAPYPSYLMRRLLTSHEAYPPQSSPPNVPTRTLGNARECGIASWFTMSAVNTPVLRHILESQSERRDDWLPVHLRGRSVPPPLSRPLGATLESG